MDVWKSREFDDHEQVCVFSDRRVGLRCVISIHSTKLGPACGGTRFKAYESDRDALEDALRLSRAMSYKSALAACP
jgi:leucine dehydrogenase